MGKFLEKIVDYKSRTGVEDPFADVKQDLSFIENDTNVWRDIQTEEVYARIILLSGSQDSAVVEGGRGTFVSDSYWLPS